MMVNMGIFSKLGFLNCMMIEGQECVHVTSVLQAPVVEAQQKTGCVSVSK